jgi:hypothetical protein
LNLIFQKDFFYDVDKDIDYITTTELSTGLKLKITMIYDINKEFISRDNRDVLKIFVNKKEKMEKRGK